MLADAYALEELTRRVRVLRPLASALGAPLRVPIGERAGAALEVLTARLRVPSFDFDGVNSASRARAFSSFEQVASAHLAVDDELRALLESAATQRLELERIVDRTLDESLDAIFERASVTSTDDVILQAYSGGLRSGSAAVVVPACGMPIELCERWLRELGRAHRVITWESRGLFGDCRDFDSAGYGVASQVEDLFAVMTHFGVENAHLVGLCGGAVIAIGAAAANSRRFDSLSLWHGDYDLGADVKKTKHRRDLLALLQMVRASRKEATALQQLFADPSMLSDIHRDLAHLFLYPYASSELLYRYAFLNGAIMEADVRDQLGAIATPTLVVTSEDDDTAHPDGSFAVAGAIPDARLHVSPHGDHLTLFEAESRSVTRALEFIATVEKEMGVA